MHEPLLTPLLGLLILITLLSSIWASVYIVRRCVKYLMDQLPIVELDMDEHV